MPTTLKYAHFEEKRFSSRLTELKSVETYNNKINTKKNHMAFEQNQSPTNRTAVTHPFCAYFIHFNRVFRGLQN